MQRAVERAGVCVILALTVAVVAAAVGAVAGSETPAGTAASAATTAGGEAETGKPVPAVWREQHLDFFYSGRTARYSCEGLRDKVRALLLDLGARRDLKIVPGACADAGVSTAAPAGPKLSLRFSSPSLPDASVKPLHEGDLKAVDARFESFVITNDAFRNMGISDCELVEEFAHQILPKLAARGVKRDITCTPSQSSGARFLVRGEVLKSLPRDEQSMPRER